MILRSLALRHGRRALAKPPVRPWRRYLASHTEQPNNPYDKPFQDQQFVEGGHNGTKSQAIHSLSSRTQPPADADLDPIASEYHARQRRKELTDHMGTTVAPHYRPHTLLSNPPSPSDITLELLMASQSHLGHSTSLWNPANARYIYGIREGIHIISLDVTAAYLRRACAIVRGVTQRGGLVLFVGTRDEQERAVVKAAEMAGGCHLFDRWIPGSITNGPQILGKCDVKAVDEFDQEVRGFEEQLQQRGALKPDLVVCLNPLENYVLLHECGSNNIPTIGVIDTDANPTWVTYPIPANDDSLRCIQVIAGVLGRAGQEGQAIRLEQARQGKLTYTASHGLKVPTSDSAASRSEEEDEFAPAPPDPLADLDPPERAAEEDIEADLLSKYEYSDLVDHDPEAVDEIDEMFEQEPGVTQIELRKPVPQDQEDPALARLIAQKRRDFGEELTEADKSVLAKMDEERKALMAAMQTTDLAELQRQADQVSRASRGASPAEGEEGDDMMYYQGDNAADVDSMLETSDRVEQQRELKDEDTETAERSNVEDTVATSRTAEQQRELKAEDTQTAGRSNVEDAVATTQAAEQQRELKAEDTQTAERSNVEDTVATSQTAEQQRELKTEDTQTTERSNVEDAVATTEAAEKERSLKSEDDGKPKQS